MEEDIKLLEEYLIYMRDFPVGENVCVLWAIENLIKAYKDLEQEKEVHAETISELENENKKLNEAIHNEYELARAQTEYEVNEYWKTTIKEKIEELKEYKVNLLKKDYAKKQMELPSQNVLVCNAIRDIAATGKIQVLEELLNPLKKV